MTKRITPEEVLEAYEATGLKPCNGVWITDAHDKHGIPFVIRACPLTVVAIHNGLEVSVIREFIRNIHQSGNPIYDKLKTLGITPEYFYEFYQTIDEGYDGGDGQAGQDARDVIKALNKAALVNWAAYAVDGTP